MSLSNATTDSDIRQAMEAMRATFDDTCMAIRNAYRVADSGKARLTKAEVANQIEALTIEIENAGAWFWRAK